MVEARGGVVLVAAGDHPAGGVPAKEEGLPVDAGRHVDGREGPVLGLVGEAVEVAAGVLPVATDQALVVDAVGLRVGRAGALERHEGVAVVDQRVGARRQERPYQGEEDSEGERGSPVSEGMHHVLLCTESAHEHRRAGCRRIMSPETPHQDAGGTCRGSRSSGEAQHWASSLPEEQTTV